MRLIPFVFLLICSYTIAQPPSYVPTNGLIGWWPLNGNGNDESGNGNNGVINGATLLRRHQRSGSSLCRAFHSIRTLVRSMTPDLCHRLSNPGGDLLNVYGWGIHVYVDAGFVFGHVGVWPDNKWYYMRAVSQAILGAMWQRWGEVNMPLHHNGSEPSNWLLAGLILCILIALWSFALWQSTKSR